jgi:type IV secretory pathway TrbL component
LLSGIGVGLGAGAAGAAVAVLAKVLTGSRNAPQLASLLIL